MLLQRDEPWSGLVRTDVELTELAIQSCFPCLNSVIFFYKNVQLPSYFFRNGNLIAAILVGITLG